MSLSLTSILVGISYGKYSQGNNVLISKQKFLIVYFTKSGMELEVYERPLEPSHAFDHHLSTRCSSSLHELKY